MLAQGAEATVYLACDVVSNAPFNVLEAVDILHRAGYVHLDRKPENIFLLDRDAVGPDSPAVRIFDFASAAVAGGAQRRARGTPYYASPEVCVRSGDIGKASDVYSLGIITYELFIGRAPIQREPWQRYPDAGAMRKAVAAVAAG